MLMNASTMNQMQKATRAASRRKTSNRSINVKINKTIGVNEIVNSCQFNSIKNHYLSNSIELVNCVD
jgi:hypothetical protein